MLLLELSQNLFYFHFNVCLWFVIIVKIYYSSKVNEPPVMKNDFAHVLPETV